MDAHDFLRGLDKVRETAPHQWVACCPAHDDKSPSMGVRDLDDGTILIHCRAGCSPEAILMSMGLDFDALFPEKPKDRPPIRRPWHPLTVFRAVANEVMIAYIVTSDVARGVVPAQSDMARLVLANKRIQAALELLRAS